jgi:hypothetical protein
MFVSPQDKEFLARVRRQYESRKKLGALYVGTAILIAIGGFWLYIHAEEHMRNLLAVFGVAQTHDEPVKQAVDLVAFSLGLKVGGALTGMALGAGSMLFYGLNFLWGQRKERLLLELSKKVAEPRFGKAA